MLACCMWGAAPGDGCAARGCSVARQRGRGGGWRQR